MWVARKKKWNNKHTALSKYLIEKIIQHVDYGEIISNQHRTTNGFTLIAEIYEVCRQTLLRTKSSRRLQSVLEEAKDNKIKSNIVNDYIIKEYFPDIAVYYQKLNPADVKNNDNLIKKIKLESEIHLKRVNLYYFNYLSTEFRGIDIYSAQFDRNAKIIDSLVACLIPYALFKGFSSDSIGGFMISTAISWPNHLIERLIAKFDTGNIEYEFVVIDSVGDSEHNDFENFLKKNNYKHEIIRDISLMPSLGIVIPDDSLVYVINHSTNDPNTFLRTLYEKSFKHFIGHRERVSLPFFSEYFKYSFWKNKASRKNKFHTVLSKKDPLNVEARNSTLRETLKVFAKSGEILYSDTDGLPLISSIRESVFYYNLALGSKSIENSLMLLWTSLETLMPYRFHDNDIDNVQYFVSKSLGFGTIGRQINSFICRTVETNKTNGNYLSKHLHALQTNSCISNNLLGWFNWLGNDFSKIVDPFEDISKSSSLLSRTFFTFNNQYQVGGTKEKKCEFWLDLIENSEKSIQYQLDRIYLHRNQIVHAGKFVNEYTNLWSHLEWYIGKLLSYVYIKYFTDKSFDVTDRRQVFMELEADSNHVKNILANNKENKISHIASELPVIFKHTWQFS